MEIRAAVVDPVGRKAYWSANVRVSGGVRKAGYRYCRMIRRSETLDSTEVIEVITQTTGITVITLRKIFLIVSVCSFITPSQSTRQGQTVTTQG